MLSGLFTDSHKIFIWFSVLFCRKILKSLLFQHTMAMYLIYNFGIIFDVILIGSKNGHAYCCEFSGTSCDAAQWLVCIRLGEIVKTVTVIISCCLFTSITLVKDWTWVSGLLFLQPQPLIYDSDIGAVTKLRTEWIYRSYNLIETDANESLSST